MTTASSCRWSSAPARSATGGKAVLRTEPVRLLARSSPRSGRLSVAQGGDECVLRTASDARAVAPEPWEWCGRTGARGAGGSRLAHAGRREPPAPRARAAFAMCSQGSIRSSLRVAARSPPWATKAARSAGCAGVKHRAPCEACAPRAGLFLAHDDSARRVVSRVGCAWLRDLIVSRSPSPRWSRAGTRGKTPDRDRLPVPPRG